jgi:hypothetical protein
MACNKWEETGMLYISGELDDSQLVQFKNHLSTCSFCSSELSQYSLEKSRFFSPDMLCVPTTPDLDRKIIALCTAVRPTQVGIFGTMWIKRIVFSALVFAFGAGAGGYFTFAYYHAQSDAAVAAAKVKSMTAPVASSMAASSAAPQSASQLSLDTSKSGQIPTLLKKNGHAPASVESHGIITVDVKKE